MTKLKKPQLRGQQLLDAIESSLRLLSSENKNYVYNASELSRQVGCSRPTLDKKKEFIDEVLEKIGVEKRIKKDHPLIEHLYTRISKLETEKETLKNELNVLRVHHAKIYSTLYMHSVDVTVLIKGVVEDESVKYGKCILCDGDVNVEYKFPDKNTVIPLNVVT